MAPLASLSARAKKPPSIKAPLPGVLTTSEIAELVKNSEKPLVSVGLQRMILKVCVCPLKSSV
jgi:hypothetical protein